MDLLDKKIRDHYDPRPCWNYGAHALASAAARAHRSEYCVEARSENTSTDLWSSKKLERYKIRAKRALQTTIPLRR